MEHNDRPERRTHAMNTLITFESEAEIVEKAVVAQYQSLFERVI